MIKVYLGIKFHADHRNKDKIESISRSLDAQKFQCICITRDVEKWGKIRFEPDQLMEKTFEIIDSCAAVVIDLSEKGVGLGIEAGYAYSKGKPVLTIAETGSDISETLTGISSQCYTYKTQDDLSAFFNNTLDHLVIDSEQRSFRELKGGNLDLDLLPNAEIDWEQDHCPWNLVDAENNHKCAEKNIALCKYFKGIKHPDIVLCDYPEDPAV